jgi:hypothetical protein
MDESRKQEITEIQEWILKLEKKIMKTQADLDAAIAALPGQIETAVTTALQPVIASIQSIAASNGVDLTNEVNSLNALPSAVAQSVAATLTPAAPSVQS